MNNIKNPVQKDDKIVQQINETIAHYEKLVIKNPVSKQKKKYFRYVKKLYILDAFPEFHENFLNLFLHYAVTRPDDMDALHLSKKLADDEKRPVVKRFRQIKCKKCHVGF